MVIVVTEEEKRRQDEATKEMLIEMSKKAIEKSQRRKDWEKTHTCPHCGNCPPFPEDLW